MATNYMNIKMEITEELTNILAIVTSAHIRGELDNDEYTALLQHIHNITKTLKEL